MKTIKLLLLFIMLGMVITSCKKEAIDFQSTTYNIRMTDAPGVYGAVYIDLKSVQVLGNNGKTYVLDTKAGRYNLLDFCNGMDTLIATGHIDASRIELIKLVLGSINTVVDHGMTYDLQTPLADQGGLTIAMHQDISSGTANNILLDFDASQSIVNMGGGQYILKPVIRSIDKTKTGAIKGMVTPLGVTAMIKVTSANHTYSTYNNGDGEFLLQGIAQGTYKVSISPPDPTDPYIVNDVTVTTGFTTNIGTINF